MQGLMCSWPNSAFISANPKTNGFNKQPKSICLFGFRNTPAPLLPVWHLYTLKWLERQRKKGKKTDESD